MRIGDVMTPNPVTIGPRESCAAAREKLHKHRIHHLLVVDEGQVVGAISVRELTGKRDHELVRNLMTDDIGIGGVDMTIRQAATLMIGRSSGCLPILDKLGRAVGIITTTDLLRLMSRNASPRPAVA
ncbi:MAG TPA: CBS domain-containing protein [Thermoanaerobaculia bacterium]|nr:CBS domain-containing protein [Thermoanaerobaculia bacterium]